MFKMDRNLFHKMAFVAAQSIPCSHIGGIFQAVLNIVKIFAFDRDRPRLNTMKSLLVRVGVENTELFCKDFLSVKPEDPQFSAAQYILVDPSCSGSGIVTRLDHLTGDNTSKQRLTSLSNFQASLLKHALHFPSAQRVVYSTCSIHPEENEQVVEDVLNQVSENFVLKKVFPDWTTRGFSDYPHGDSMIRVCTDKHFTNGFFVACFERTPSGNNSEESKGKNSEHNQDIEGIGKDENIENTSEEPEFSKKAQKRKHLDKNKFVKQNEENEIVETSSSKKKKKKQLEDGEGLLDDSALIGDINNSHSSKKKKKKKNIIIPENQVEVRFSTVNSGEESTSKKMKKRKSENERQSVVDSESRTGDTENSTCVLVEKKHRKHKSKKEKDLEDCSLLINSPEESSVNKKKRKNESELEDCSLLMNSSKESISKKEKHKLDNKGLIESSEFDNNDNSSTHSSKRKKKKKRDIENENQMEQCSLLVNSGEENCSKKKKKKHKETDTKDCSKEQTESINVESARDKSDDRLENLNKKKSKKRKKKHSKIEQD